MAEALTEEEEFRVSQSEPAQRWTAYQWYLVALLVVVNISAGLDRHVMAILQEPMKRELRLNDGQLGVINGPAFALFYAFSAIPIARFAERMSRPRLLAIMLSVWSGATAICGLAVNFLTMSLCRVGVGLGEGGAHPICQSVVADNFTVRQRGAAMSIYAAGPSTAAILAPALGGLMAHLWGWRVAFAVIGAPGLLLAAIAGLTVKEPRQAAGAAVRKVTTFWTDMRWILKNRPFVFIFIAGSFNGMGITGIGAFVPSFVIRTQGFNLAQAGGVAALLGIMGLLGVLLGGWLADRFADAKGRSYVTVPAFGALASLGFYLLAFTQHAWPLVVAGLLGGALATQLKSGPNFAAIQNVVPSHMRATSAALFTLASNVIGVTVGALMVGWISDMAAAHAFPATMGAFSSACSGGHPAAGAAPALAAACKQASADGLRSSLALVSLVFVGAAAFFWLAGRDIEINRD